MSEPTRRQEPAEIRPPVFGLSDDPILVAFKSLQELEHYAEPWDVRDGAWTFWDRRGRVLEATPYAHDCWTSLRDSGVVAPLELRVHLVEALADHALRSEFDHLELDELAILAEQYLNRRVDRNRFWWLPNRWTNRRSRRT